MLPHTVSGSFTPATPRLSTGRHDDPGGDTATVPRQPLFDATADFLHSKQQFVTAT